MESEQLSPRLLDLPPTSYSIRQGHIPRWFYLYRYCSSLMTNDFGRLDCEDFSWKRLDGDLLPNKSLNLIPDDLSKTCSCMTGCATDKCGCKGQKYSCSNHCKCLGCKNGKT